MGDVSRVRVQQGSCVAYLLLVLFTGAMPTGITSPVCVCVHTFLAVLLACLHLCPSHLETESTYVDLYLVIMMSLKRNDSKSCSLGDSGFQLARRGAGVSLDSTGKVEIIAL